MMLMVIELMLYLPKILCLPKTNFWLFSAMLIKIHEQDVNIGQGSMLYICTENVLVNLIN